MLIHTRYTASFVSTGLRCAVIAALILLSGCGGGSDSDSKPPDEVIDQCPVDDTKIEEGLCGCGVPDTDTDNDGTPDCLDACPDDPGTMPDEFGFCGDTGDSAIVVEGEALTLAVNGAVLTIPADALAPGTAVTLTEIDPASLDEQPNGPSENRVTPIYALEFSEAQLAGENLIFALDVPAAIGSSTYAGIQTTGGLSTDDYSDIEWLLHFGDFDAAQSLLVIELGATATRFLVAGLTRTPADAAAIATGEALQTPSLMKARALAIPAAAAAPTEVSDWAEHGFIVACNPTKFLKRGDERCDPLAPGFVPMMAELGRALYESAQQLTNLGFRRGQLTRINSLPEVDIPKLVYDPDGLSDATVASSGGTLTYWIVWADPKEGTTAGYYDPQRADGVIHVDVDWPFDRTSQFAIHELMHSVQRKEIREAWDEDWIIEGLAASVEPNAPSYSGPTGAEFRVFGNEIWRDWRNYLTSDEDSNNYQAHEFWLSLTGDMSSIPVFYDELAFYYDLGTDANSQRQVDAALTQTGLPSLPDAYTDLILTRDGQADYPHCVGEDNFSVCSGESCETAVEELQPFSAHCLYEDVSFHSCDDQPVEMTVTLVPDAPNPNMKLILDGTVYDANTPVPFPEDGKRVWVINTDLNNQVYTSGPAPQANLVYKNVSLPCDIKLLQQVLFLRLNVRAGGENEYHEETYFSFEDLTQPSYVNTWEGGPGVPVDVATMPLGFAPGSVSFSSAVQWDDGGTVISASGSASIQSQTMKVATGLLTTVQLETVAFISDRGYDSTFLGTQARVDGDYTFETKDVAAELNLTWGCDLSDVRVRYLQPVTLADSTLLFFHNNSIIGENIWECGTRQLIIPPNTVFRVSMSSRNMAFFRGVEYENEGGSFEIDIRPIEASD